MTTQAVADSLVKLCQAGDFWGAINGLYADNAVSVEMFGDETHPKETVGLAGIKAKSQWWVDNHDVHSAITEGPLVADPYFSVVFDFDVTFKPTGKRTPMPEIGVYEVRNGKIVRVQFFYSID